MMILKTNAGIFFLTLFYCCLAYKYTINNSNFIWNIYFIFINIAFISIDIVWSFLCVFIIEYFHIKYEKKAKVLPLLIFSNTILYIYYRCNDYPSDNIIWNFMSYLPVIIPKLLEAIQSIHLWKSK